MIRKAELKDLKMIIALESVCFPDPYPLSFWEKCISDPNYLCYVFETGGNLAGYLVAQSADAYDLMRICVALENRKTGIGKLLIDQLKDKPVALEVAADNTGAIAFYEKCGFVLASVRRGYYSPGRDALVCIKPKI